MRKKKLGHDVAQRKSQRVAVKKFLNTAETFMAKQAAAGQPIANMKNEAKRKGAFPTKNPLTPTVTPTVTAPLTPTVTAPLTSTVTAPLTPTVTALLTDTSDKKTNNETHKAIYKIFPSTYPNNRGRYVGKEYIQLLKDPSFMDHFDDVDFYMNSLFKNMVNDLTDEKSGKKKTTRSILPYFEKVIQFDPTIYKKAVASGGKKSRKHRKTYKKNKNQKRRTYKKK